jgi:hypothetical protein
VIEYVDSYGFAIAGRATDFASVHTWSFRYHDLTFAAMSQLLEYLLRLVGESKSLKKSQVCLVGRSSPY